MQKIVTSDIVNNIERNLSAGNINADDANQLVELTNQLYDQIILYYQEKGGENAMKPLLPGAMELPNDKYRFRIDELEKENRSLADENSALADKNSALMDENSALEDENAMLRARIAALEGNPS